jgi:hypothetical protein
VKPLKKKYGENAEKPRPKDVENERLRNTEEKLRDVLGMIILGYVALLN